MKKKLQLISTVLIFFIFQNTSAQQTTLSPTNWWVGMKWNKVQILLYNNSTAIKNSEVKINYTGVSLAKINKLDNEKYLAIDVIISPKAKPGNVQISLKNGNEIQTLSWPIAARRNGNGTSFAQGVRSSDFIYELMPDRFSNGDYTNDKIPNLLDQSLNRDSMYHRHGGDLQGVTNHLDYLKDLGVTTIWMTPVLLNDMPERTEHGYAITDHYKVDERIGGAKAYKNLSDELHKRGMKLIQDAIYNHVGIKHFTIQDKPMKDWLHEWPTFTQTSYKEQTIFDPYAAPSQTKKMVDGCFDSNLACSLQTNHPPFFLFAMVLHKGQKWFALCKMFV